MILLTAEQAAVLDDVMTMASQLAQSAYTCGADIVHYKVNIDAVLVLVLVPRTFRLPAYNELHPSYPLKLDAEGRENAKQNGSGAHVYYVNLPYDVAYCEDTPNSEDVSPSVEDQAT